jgi:hypothetical protein
VSVRETLQQHAQAEEVVAVAMRDVDRGQVLSASSDPVCKRIGLSECQERIDQDCMERYSSHDNPVERIWVALKAWLANSPTLTIQGRVRQVHIPSFASATPRRC